MDFAFSEEQEAFRDALRRFLAEVSPTSEVLRLAETPLGHDPAVWKRMASELGLPGLAIPEAYGGQGFGFLELAIALEETGRALLCAPFFSTACLAAEALLACATEAQKRELLPPLAAGEQIATVALLDDGESWGPEEVALAWEGDAARPVLRGRKRLVTDGACADLLLVVARRPGSRGAAGVSLLAVRGGDGGRVVARPVDPLDPTRRLADLAFDGARAEVVGEEGRAAPALDRALARAAAGVAAECAGGAQACLDAAVTYARQRVQFGRPIGSFQAVQHKCAEVLLEVESARVAAHYAAWVAAGGGAGLALAASLAKSFCGEAYRRAAAENLQIHGGIGYTWEAAPQLHYKRAAASDVLLGDAALHRRRIAGALGL